MESLRGSLLIASPALLDPNFSRAVVLIGEHNEDGAMGLVLNRPSTTTVGEVVPDLDALADPQDSVFVGGPVDPTVIMVLARFEETEDAEIAVSRGIGLLPAGVELDDLEQTTTGTRVYAGYAGWGPGQLESEIERSDWVIEAPEDDDIFSEDPDTLWGDVLNRMGGRYALLARMPADPSLN